MASSRPGSVLIAKELGVSGMLVSPETSGATTADDELDGTLIGVWLPLLRRLSLKLRSIVRWLRSTSNVCVISDDDTNPPFWFGAWLLFDVSNNVPQGPEVTTALIRQPLDANSSKPLKFGLLLLEWFTGLAGGWRDSHFLAGLALVVGILFLV